MLVLVVIAITASLVVFSTGSSEQRQLQDTALRLKTVINSAADEALLQGADFGLAFPPSGYQILYFNPDELSWEAVDDKLFAFHPVPEDIVISTTIEGDRIDEETLAQLALLKNRQQQRDLQPQVLILSSGEITPFTLTLTHQLNDQSLILASDGISSVVLQ